MARITGDDLQEQQVIDDIQHYGWHCISIGAEEDLPPFTFTIGLFHTFKYPELIIFGLKSEVAHQILSIAVDSIKEGQPLDLSKSTEKFVDGYPSVFIEVPKAEYREHVGFCLWYYEGDDFPLYQIVWPSKANLFPWNPDVSESFRAIQPVLGQAPKTDETNVKTK